MDALSTVVPRQNIFTVMNEADVVLILSAQRQRMEQSEPGAEKRVAVVIDNDVQISDTMVLEKLLEQSSTLNIFVIVCVQTVNCIRPSVRERFGHVVAL